MNEFFSKKDKEAVEKTFNFIERIVGINRSKFLSDSRYKENVQARYTAWYILKNYYDFSYGSIGEYFKRDHTTVIHGIKIVEEKKIGENILSSFKLHLSTYPQA